MDSSMNRELIKPVTYYNEWFISAIKSAKVDGSIKVKKLLQNCLNCQNQVKPLVTVSKFDEFRLNTTICLLLGCPSIYPLIEVSDTQELMSLVKSIPEIDFETFYLIVKGLKNNKYIRGIFPWLPSDIVVKFMCNFLKHSTNLTPLSLALCFEMFYSLMYTIQFDDILNDTVSENIENYIKYLESYEKTVSNQSTSKLIAYYFMYVIESIYVLIKYLDYKTIEEPSTCSLGLKLKALKIEATKSDELQYKSCVEKSIPLLSQILNKLALCISLDIWISWYDLKAPSIALFCDEKLDDDDDDKTTENTIQTQIAHTVFRVMRVKNKLDKFDDILNLNSNKELENFLNQVAVDPDYDSDTDLSTLELIEAVEQGSPKKRKKLMTLLLNRDDIYEVKESLYCLKENMNNVSRSAALLFIKGFIKKAKDVIRPDEWKSIVIDLSKRITNNDVVNILKEDLNHGHDDILKTKLFLSDFTHICNQLSHQADTECFDSYLRLCLQSGVDVIKNSIDMAISLSGLSPVFASAFRIVHFICRSKGKSGISLTTDLLVEKLKEEIPFEVKNELFVFILELLEKSDVSFDVHESLDLSSSYQNLPVDVNEVLEDLVCTRLKIKNEDEDYLSLFNLLKILEKIIRLHTDVVLKSKVKLSCIASLILIHNNCCYLDSKNCNLHVQIRNSIEKIIYILEQLITKDIGNYEEEFGLLKICLSRYELHCRSVLLLSRFIGEKITYNFKSIVDQIFNCIWKKSQNEDDITLPDCNRIEWIWALYIILPSCAENEWLSAIYVTHSYLNQNIGDSHLVTPTLKLFHEVFLILCDKSKQDDSLLPLQYCFKSFSMTAMKFTDDKLQNEENKFFLIANLFSWWCKAQRALDCNPEYPVLFLNLIVGILVDLVREKYLIIEDNSDDKFGLASKVDSFEATSSEILVNSTNAIGLGSQDNLVNGVKDDSIVNGFEENDDEKGNMSCSKTLMNKSSVTKVTSRVEFNDYLNSMIKIFICCIRPSELTSTVAGKLKLLCEF